MFSTPWYDPRQMMFQKAQSSTSSTEDTPRVCTQSMTLPTCNFTTSPIGAFKDFPMKPKLLDRKRNGSPNVLDTLRTYSLPPAPEFSVFSTLRGPIANLTASVDYLTWLGGGSSHWNVLPPSIK